MLNVINRKSIRGKRQQKKKCKIPADNPVAIRLHNHAKIWVKTMLATYPDRSLPSLTNIGYLHIDRFLQEKITLDQCSELIKRDSRHYAKRQMTWFRKETGIQWIQHEQEAKSQIYEFLKFKPSPLRTPPSLNT